MTREAFQRALNSFTRRRPFQPFEIEFASGDAIHVTHPEAARIRGNLVIFVATTGRQRLFDSSSVCQILDAPREQELPSFGDDEPL